MRRIILVAFVLSALATIGPSSAFGGTSGSTDGCPPGVTNPDYCQPCGELENGDWRDNYLPGTECDDQQYGMGGDDYLNGRGGDDYQNGGTGNDTLDGGKGNDVQYGGDGNDTIYGRAGNDTIYAGPGRDYVDCGGGRDVAYVDKSDTTTNCETVIRVKSW